MATGLARCLCTRFTVRSDQAVYKHALIALIHVVGTGLKAVRWRYSVMPFFLVSSYILLAMAWDVGGGEIIIIYMPLAVSQCPCMDFDESIRCCRWMWGAMKRVAYPLSQN